MNTQEQRMGEAPEQFAAVSLTVTHYGGVKLPTSTTILLSTPLWGTNYYGGLPSPDTLSVVGA